MARPEYQPLIKSPAHCEIKDSKETDKENEDEDKDEDEEFEESDQEEDQGVGMTQGILGDSDQEAG